MSDLDAIGGLQVVIILLLLQPQRRRERVFGLICVCVATGFGIYYLAPPLLGFIFAEIEPIIQKLGWPLCLTIVGVLAYILIISIAARGDSRQNLAIRTGSKEAFEERVKTYIRDFNYSEEDAIAATERIRDASK